MTLMAMFIAGLVTAIAYDQLALGAWIWALYGVIAIGGLLMDFARVGMLWQIRKDTAACSLLLAALYATVAGSKAATAEEILRSADARAQGARR